MARKAATSDGAADTATRQRRRARQDGPEDTRRRLLDAATEEFAATGLMGGRVDVIARRAGLNKQLIYYHFGDKDGLYAAVLEAAYQDIRQRERQLDLGQLDPAAAMDALAGFSFDYLVENPNFVKLLIDENVHQAVHIRNSAVLRDLRSPFIDLLAEVLERGATTGIFRDDVDPTQFYVSLAGICFFYFTNIHTLSELFGRDLHDAGQIARRRAHVLDFVRGYLRPLSGQMPVDSHGEVGAK